MATRPAKAQPITPENSVTHPCQGTSKTTGEPCKRQVAAGKLVCHFHGGAFPTVKNAAQRRRAEIEARVQTKARIMRNGGHATMEDAYAELETLAGEAAIFRQVCFDRLTALREDQWRYEGKAGEQLRSEVALYERAMDRSQKFLIDYAKLGIAEKRVKIAEAQAMMLVGVIQNVLGRLELSRDQKRIAASVVPEELRAIAAPGESNG